MKWRIVLGIAVITAFSSCIFTFYPLYSDDVLVDVPGLDGVFADQQNFLGFMTEDSTIWRFEREGKGKYTLEIDEDGKTGKLEVHAVQLGGEYFLDFIVDELETDEIPDFILLHLVPMHSYAKIKVHEDRLELYWINVGWAQENLEKHRIRIKHETRESDESVFILLTADTEDLQKFATKYARHDEAFEDPDVLERMIAH